MLLRLFWPASIIAILLAVRLIVPDERIKRFAFHGFVWGFLLALAHNYLWVFIFRFWTIHHLLIPQIPIPLAVLVYWWGTVIVQDHLLLEVGMNRWILLAIFAGVHAVLVQSLVWLGYLGFHRGWTFGYTFIVAYVYQWIMYLFFVQWIPRRIRS